MEGRIVCMGIVNLTVVSHAQQAHGADLPVSSQPFQGNLRNYLALRCKTLDRKPRKFCQHATEP